MMQGTVKWFNNDKGYGFIECDKLSDIFVHYSAIVKEGYKTLNEGATVSFKLIETSKGLISRGSSVFIRRWFTTSLTTRANRKT